MASATFAENFFFASLIQVVPIGAIEANNLMLCGKVHFTQGQRQSLSVPAQGEFIFTEHPPCPLTTLITPMPAAICTAYTVPFGSLL